jgi:hypothetical protein
MGAAYHDMGLAVCMTLQCGSTLLVLRATNSMLILTIFCCRMCDLDASSLAPLCQLSSLRELKLDVPGVMYHHGTQPILDLMSSAVQGCLLKIINTGFAEMRGRRKTRRAADALVAEKGSRNVAVLELDDYGDDDEEEEEKKEGEQHQQQQQQHGVVDGSGVHSG